MPFINKTYIQSLRRNLENFKMTTLACPFLDNQEASNISKVKVEIDNTKDIALNFQGKLTMKKILTKLFFII